MVRNSRQSLTQFIEQTRAELNSIAAEAETKLAEIDNKILEISNKEESAQTDLGAIQQVKTDVNGILTTIQSYQEKFETLQAKLDDEDDGLEANFNYAKAISDDLDNIKVTSQAELSELEKIHQSALKLKEKIAEYENITTGYKTQIQETYDFMNGQGLAHSFFEQKKSLEKITSFWLAVLIATLIAFFSLVFTTYVFSPDFLLNLSEVDSWIDVVVFILSRTFLFGPLVFMVWYSAVQYGREREDMRQYAFKGGVAKALQNYTDLLADKFKDKPKENSVRDAILGFTIATMHDIYSNPHSSSESPKPEKEKWSFGSSKKTIAKFRDEVVKPTTEIVKELKDSVTL